INRTQMQPKFHLDRPDDALPLDTVGQDERFRRAFAVLQRGISERAFPGASVAVTYKGKLVALIGVGRFTYSWFSRTVIAADIYDLDSLRKVVATTATCMKLYDRGKFDLDRKVVEIVPEFGSDDRRRGEISFRMVMAHSSGLPAYVKLFETAKTRDELLDRA